MLGKRILITGGNGYIGGRLASFLDKDYDVILGARGKIKSPELSHLTSVKMDWDSEKSLDAACQGVDVIVHTAAMNSQESHLDPTAAFSVNTIATSRLLQSAKKNKVARFIYLSTSHVYGKELEGIVSESSQISAFDPYASSHKAAEDLVLYENFNNGIEGVIIRLSNAFGFPMHASVNCWDLLVPNLCLQGVEFNSLRLKSSGVQLINFVTISDVVRSIRHLFSIKVEQFDTPVFNIGGKGMSVLSMTKLVVDRFSKLKGKTLKIYRPCSHETEKINRFTYSTRMIENTGFVALNNMDEEIDHLINFCYKSF